MEIVKKIASVVVHSMGAVVLVGLLNRSSFGRTVLGTDVKLS